MKILYLAHRIPYPPNKGDKIRSFNEIKYLSDSYEIHLVCLADNSADLKYEINLTKYCKMVCVVPLKTARARAKSLTSLIYNMPLSIGHFYSHSLQTTINHWLSSNEYDTIVCFSSPMAEYILNQSTNQLINQSTKLIMDFVDVDSDKWLQYSQRRRFPLSLIYRIESRRLLKYEKQINQHFDHSVFVTHQEANLFSRLYPKAKNLAVIPNGVDYNYFSPGASTQQPDQPNKPNKPQKNPPILLFAGAMDYYANVEGAIWFCHQIFPMIKREFPESEFYIVGSNPHPRVRDLSKRSGVRVTGFVKDIRPYYQAAHVCVIPLRLARGIQNKVLEAMAMEKPVVATAKAVEGIQAVPEEHLVVKDTPRDFSDAVSRLLKDEKARKQLGTSARDFVIKNHHWPTNMKKLEALLHAQ